MDFQTFRQTRYSKIPTDDFGPHAFANRGWGGDLSDIVAHLPMLEFLARQCDHCTEFGFRDANSTAALLSGCRGKVVSYDIHEWPDVSVLRSMELPCLWEFVHADTSDPSLKIKCTDLLFIDTKHTYAQVKAELRQAPQVSKYIVLHDTWSKGEKTDEGDDGRGILPAMREFLEENELWKLVYQVNFNHGLSVLQRNIPL